VRFDQRASTEGPLHAETLVLSVRWISETRIPFDNNAAVSGCLFEGVIDEIKNTGAGSFQPEGFPHSACHFVNVDGAFMLDHGSRELSQLVPPDCQDIGAARNA